MAPKLSGMGKRMLQRRLSKTSDRLRSLRVDLQVLDEQRLHFGDEADDARIRALVSETPLSDREHRDAQRHADAHDRQRQAIVDEIGVLEKTQDDLLDQMTASGGGA